LKETLPVNTGIYSCSKLDETGAGVMKLRRKKRRVGIMLGYRITMREDRTFDVFAHYSI